MKLGNIVEAAVKPFARAINHPCLDEEGNTRPDSKCGAVINKLNDFSDAGYDFLWPSSTKQKE